MVNFSNRFLIDLVCQNMLQTCFHWSCLDNGTMVCQTMSLSCTQICSYNLMLQIPHHHTHHHMSHPLHHNCHTSSHLISHVQCTLQCLFVFACIYLDPFHTRANFSTKCKYMHQIQLFLELRDSRFRQNIQIKLQIEVLLALSAGSPCQQKGISKFQKNEIEVSQMTKSTGICE